MPEKWRVVEVDPNCGAEITGRDADSEEDALMAAGLMKGYRLIRRPDGSWFQYDPPEPKPVDRVDWF
ncbi:MAG: hypothetical protein HYV13_03900 [Candidatus Doudnabacteria bacterium]|nr:hypothetical protein [Candidatus Doudnabacteria bacterium]